jgi:hypothetical protein
MIARICGPKAHYFIKYNSSSSNENNNSDKKAPQNLNEVIQVREGITLSHKMCQK